MSRRLSISRFDNLPLAGLLALLIVFAVDRLALGIGGPWESLQRRIPPGFAPEEGVTEDRLQIRGLRAAPPGQPRVVVLGSSRAKAGFQTQLVPPGKPDVAYGKIAHGGVRAFEIRSLVDEILDLRPQVVVLVLSEFDLNRPNPPLPHLSSGSFSAIRDLIAESGLAFSIEHRQLLLRMMTAGILNSYRFRPVLHRALVDDLRRFELDERFPRVRVERSTGWSLLETGAPRTFSPEERRSILADLNEAFPKKGRQALRNEFLRVQSVSRGPHFDLYAGILRRTVQRLIEAGVGVVIAEAPLHSISEQIYDTTIRADFLAFAESLSGQPGVRFIPLESSGPYKDEDFFDLLHLGRQGAVRFTRAIASAVNQSLRSQTADSDG